MSEIYPYLEAENIAVGYGSHRLIQQFNLIVHPGHTVVILGDNGTGKSSLLRTLAHMQKPLTGQVTLNVDPFLLETTQPFFGELTVVENLTFWHQLFVNSKMPSADIKQQFHLTSLWHMPMSLLSDGQLQRVKLSLLALTTKKLWLVDEPYASLDATNTLRVKSFFQRYCQSGGSIVMTLPKLEQHEAGRIVNLNAANTKNQDKVQ